MVLHHHDDRALADVTYRGDAIRVEMNLKP